MKVIKNERVLPCDVDETLVLHDLEYINTTPYSTVQIFCPFRSRLITLVRHEPMIQLLKEESTRGATILIWSRGGHQWAEAVIKALNLEKYVDIVMSKPLAYLDDKEVGDWMKDRVYIKPNTPYKNL